MSKQIQTKTGDPKNGDSKRKSGLLKKAGVLSFLFAFAAAMPVCAETTPTGAVSASPCGETAGTTLIVGTAAEETAPEESGTGSANRGRCYDVTDDQLLWIAACCAAENGTDANALRFEASLVANLTDEGRWGDNPYSVVNSSWFSDAAREKAQRTKSTITDELLGIVRDVLCSGNRSTDANEHDCFGDITKIITNGTEYTSQTDIRNTANYVSGNTVIRNRMGSSYLFECFPTTGSDPFGRRIDS